ncbi:MAG: histidine kinase [Clostridia bacterium]|nr:histidine kinase [Clostridia bacterium]
MLDIINNVLNAINYILNTKTKRHIVGGALISTSMLLGGLALTIMTIKNEKEEEVLDDE